MFRTLIAAGLVAMAAALGAASVANAETYYRNCAAARDAGVTPILQGQDGYAEHLDRDGDGVACE
ncbi:calcium-binding protein [Mycolicibacterium tusciae]|jgi:hypothetical protein|uniref:Calcium-binding protein n=1 Tax=Mycolicibacterium tusciae TaxID=75922 RepID=A0A1X0JWS5_9MYCO|nr:excalibur calcium-binding domain-containing protein [Mycolicibacterium tusciae]ORB67160.1 calcium-binding protein [Mycolicibacterium tusciae]